MTRMLKIDIHAHYLPRDWPNLAAKYGDALFAAIHHTEDGRHRIYKDGRFFREIWSKTWDVMGADSMPKQWLPWLVGMPAEQSRVACSLIFGEQVPGAGIEEIALDEAGKARLYNGTALEWLGLPQSRFT